MKKLLILLVFVALAGCEKENKLSQDDLNALNSKLVGAWREIKKDGADPVLCRYITFSPDFKRSVYTSTEKWENRATDKEAAVDSLPYRLDRGRIFYHELENVYFNYMVDDNTLILDGGHSHSDFFPGDTRFVSSYERIVIE